LVSKRLVVSVTVVLGFIPFVGLIIALICLVIDLLPREWVIHWIEPILGLFVALLVLVPFADEYWAFPAPCCMTFNLAVGTVVAVWVVYSAHCCAVVLTTRPTRVFFLWALCCHVTAIEGVAL
jgi:hypothetical protein